MLESFAYQWDGHRLVCRRTRGQLYRLLERGLQVLLAAAFLTASAGLGLEAVRSAQAADTGSAEAPAVPPGPMTFDDCVRVAIHYSPFLTKSAVEIDVRRFDESDSRYGIIPPPMTFRTYYYVSRPEQPGFKSQPYSLSFSMDSYNPFGSYFTLQAQKVATQMAIYAHLQQVNLGLERLGKMFLHLAATKQVRLLQENLASLCKESLTFAENRRSIGTGTALEVQVATQELEVAKSELERLARAQKRTLNSIKLFMGFKPEQQVELDLRDARRQVLGSFDPTAATLEQAKARSFELKGLEMKKEMQGYNITVAKARILPNLLFNATTPDPLNVTTARGIYVGLGLELPVWDGFKRIRNVSRQKAILKQYGADKDSKEVDITDKWNDLQDNISNAAAAVKMTKSQEELSRLKERQAEIRYNSGSEQLPTWLDSRKSIMEAQKGSASKALEYDQLILGLRQLSGDLGNSYVDQKSWQK